MPQPAATPAATDAIQPGLMVVHGNHLEDLRDLLLQWLARAPLAPLENELMLVQSNGIAQWLKLALAKPRDKGGMGISAAVEMQLPGRFLWQAYRAVLGREQVPADSPFDKSRLVWRLMRLLPAMLDQADFAPLQHYLGGGTMDAAKLFSLAQQIADLFDQYQVYRADWLDGWEHGRDTVHNAIRGVNATLPADQRWQAALWRALLDDVGEAQRNSHRAAVHRAFLKRASTLALRPAALPRRIVVFGISSLPQQTLEALAALAPHCQILLMVSNPCRHYWAGIIEGRELLKAERRRQANKPGLPATPRYEDLHLQANPLLAAWGKQGRDYIRLLDVFDDPDTYRSRFDALGGKIDLYAEPEGNGLLQQVQTAILDLEPLPADPAQRRTLDASDDSLRFHIAHNPQREVEILHDNLLALFEQAERTGKPLEPRDVMVMVPDIATYAPHIQAVFGRIPTTDARYLPCSIADRPARGAAPLLVALEQLLRLPESRLAAGDVLDLLDAPALRRRFRLGDGDLPVLRRWIDGAGIRWGLDGAQKATFELPPEEQNTWRFGLRRMLLGYAVGDGESLDGIAPYVEIGGLDAALVGPLVDLVARLGHYGTLFANAATPADWAKRLRALLHDLFDAGRDDNDTLLLQRLGDALDDWAQTCAEAGFADPLPLAVVREHWLAGLDERRLSQRFGGGAVSFGTLLPMRAIPFRVVCLLGMNDGDYPRRSNAPDYDLMALPAQQRPGDRSRREDDRYLFLEALLAARDTLYVSWVGKSARDNSTVPPSVLVGQLRDYLAAGWQTDSGTKLLDTLTTQYPLQAFSLRYFQNVAASDTNDAHLFTYAIEWQRARDATATPAESKRPSWRPESAITLASLQRFLRCPARYFYAERLGVRFDPLETVDEDSEPFALDGLEQHGLVDELLRAGIAQGIEAIEPAAQRQREQGRLPVGNLGSLALQPIAMRAAAAVTQWHELSAHYPASLITRELRHAAHGIAIEDWLGDLREGDDGLVRLVATASKLTAEKQGELRVEKLLDTWTVHLLANANALKLTSIVIAPDATVRLQPIDASEAREQLDTLLAAYHQGMQAPLPITRRTAYAWLGDGNDPSKAAARSYDRSANDYGHGEVEDDDCLARHWPDFAHLHAAGFERWLPAYAPLAQAVATPGDAA